MKKLICYLLVLSFCMSGSSTVFASDTINRRDLEKYQIEDVQWLDDESPSQEMLRLPSSKWVLTVLSSSSLYERFVEYVTDEWAYADKYTYAKSTTISVGISGNLTYSLSEALKGQIVINGSYSTGTTTAISIPADPSRKSKLGRFSDYDYSYVQCDYYLYYTNPTPTSTEYHGVYDPVHDTSTLKVIYY